MYGLQKRYTGGQVEEKGAVYVYEYVHVYVSLRKLHFLL